MPVKKKEKKTKVRTITKTKNVNTNINNVHVHVEKPKPRKRRTVKPKPIEPIPLNNNNSLNRIRRGVSNNVGFHPRGLINNEIQQPTIVQQVNPTIDPRLEKLEKRTKKIKEYLKDNRSTKETAINVNSPQFIDAFTTPKQEFQDAMETPIKPKN